jgi:hypothetical protein
MENSVKIKISEALNAWLDPANTERSGNALQQKSGVSTSVISHIKNGKFEIMVGNKPSPISPAQFLKIADAIGYVIENEDIHWDFTDSFRKIQSVCRSTQTKRRIVTLESELSGLGKTYGLEHYETYNDKVVYIKCERSWKSKNLINSILTKLKIRTDSKDNISRLALIREKLTSQPGWLIILDEAEYISNTVWHTVKEIIDFIYGKCGLIVSGIDISYKINKYADKKKEGFPQLKRRLFSEIATIQAITKKEKVAILEKHGIVNKTAIEFFAKHVHDYQMMRIYIQDALHVSSKTGSTIDGAFLMDLFFNTQNEEL